MLSKIGRAAANVAARHAAAGRRGASTAAASTHAALSTSVRCAPVMPHIAAAASSAGSTASVPSASLRWLLLLGSSLLVGGLALADASAGVCGGTSVGSALCEAAAAAGQPVPLEASIGAVSNSKDSTAAGSPYNPLPPAYDHWNSNWDGLDSVPPSIDAKTGRPLYVTRHLLFIRHGQYVLPDDSTPEDHDPVLTAKGHEQARLTGERLRELGIDVAVIHASTMARAAQTAEGIAAYFPGVPIRKTDLLREGVPALHVPTHPTWRPSPEDVRDDPPRIARGFEEIVQRWREFDGAQVRTQAEWEAVRVARLKQDPQVLAARKQAAAAAAADGQATPAAPSATGSLSSTSAGTIDVSGGRSHPSSRLEPIYIDRYELVVCHGNVIRAHLLRALQLPVQAWLRMAIHNTGISHLIIRPTGNVSLYSMGDTGHLSKDLITYH